MLDKNVNKVMFHVIKGPLRHRLMVFDPLVFLLFLKGEYQDPQSSSFSESDPTLVSRSTRSQGGYQRPLFRKEQKVRQPPKSTRNRTLVQ